MNASTATTDQSGIELGLRAHDFLLDPEAFVERCIAGTHGTDSALTPPLRAALAEAIRAGRPRIEVLEAIRSYVAPFAGTLDRSPVDGVGRNWSNCIVPDNLAHYAPGDDVAFIQQVFSQILNRSPTPIEAVEAKFDLRGARLSRNEFIQRIALRSP